MQEGKINAFIGERNLSLWDDKIRIVDVHQTLESSYDRIEHIESGSERYYIYMGAISAIIIPFSAFTSDDEKQALINYMKQKTNNIIKN